MATARARPLTTALVTLLLAIHAWLAVSATLGKSVTSDETAHLTAGYAYWKFNDYRLQPENGNLPQRWAALPLLLQRPHLEPRELPLAWSMSDVWTIAQRFLFEAGNNSDYLLAVARATMVLWSVATGLLVFVWSRRLWDSPAAGLLSLSLYSFSTTTLAHGPLVTSDMTITALMLAAVGAFWRHLERPSATSLVLSALLTGLAAIAKFSFLLLAPMFVVLALWWLATPARRGPVPWPRLASSAAVHVAAVFAVVWAAFGFRHSGFAPGLPEGMKYYITWERLLPDSGFWRGALLWLKQTAILPEAYLHGFAYVLKASGERGAFLAGNYSNTGWWWFFPYAFLIKSTPAELLALLGGAALAAARQLSRFRSVKLFPPGASRALVPLGVVVGVYGLASVAGNLNIGHRHILPLYPVLFIAAGALASRLCTNRGRVACLGLVLLAATTAWRAHPNYLAYFNRLAGGADERWRQLVDSSLDWGQELPSISRWLEAHRQPEEAVFLAYFGMGDPAYEGIDAIPLAPYYFHRRLRPWTELEPGLFVISATMLQDVYSPWRGPWTTGRENAYQTLLASMRAEIASGERAPLIADFGEGPSQPLWNLDRLRFARLAHYLRVREPEAIINHSVLVYRLSAHEIHTMVDGGLSEVVALMQQALERPR